METSDDTSQFKDKYGKLGTFTVKFWRVKLGHHVPPLNDLKTNETAVPEKALKGRPLDVKARFVHTQNIMIWLTKAASCPNPHRMWSRQDPSPSLTRSLWQTSPSNIELAVSMSFLHQPCSNMSRCSPVVDDLRAITIAGGHRGATH